MPEQQGRIVRPPPASAREALEERLEVLHQGGQACQPTKLQTKGGVLGTSYCLSKRGPSFQSMGRRGRPHDCLFISLRTSELLDKSGFGH